MLIKNILTNSMPANNIPTNNVCLGLISINEMNNDTSWEKQPTSSGEKAIILYLNDVSQVIAVMIVIMGIGILVDGVVFKKIEDKVMTRWGLR